MRIARLKDSELDSTHFAILNDLASAALLPASFDISALSTALAGDADELRKQTVAVIPLPGPSQITDRYFFLPPVSPSKVLCVGLNYAKHVHEFSPGAEPPKKPLIFTKLPSAVIPTHSFIRWSSETKCVDYEGELAVVIGKKCRHVQIDESLDYVLGYTCANDVTARDWQKSDGQWTRAKGSDTFCPLGPYLLSPAELSATASSLVPAPTVRIRTLVNGDVKQDAPIGQMVHSVAEIVSYCASFCTLLPGDVILTGTPEGVGMGTDPPTYLASGDNVVVELETCGFRMQLVSQCRGLEEN